MINWAFIFKSDGCSAKRDHTILNHCEDRLFIYGVDTVEEGIEVAKRLIAEENCSLIELCGGFGEEGAKRIIEAIDGKICVGHIAYLPGEQEKFRAYKQANQLI